ncbi:YciI family protein [Pseudorhodobacter sp. E13]|uniref:YciI family protein n=1 Tax=Pseudorhodobacter sp. E13 TaxID=2487931 RepID=UPI000F8D440F|nr:YciI family protein [Pseudorhodobacter sp. E13]RUS63704.1 YciI family protein [Pseudorhodobacter sp. E13]
MKYIALIYSDPAREPKPGTPEGDADMQAYFTLNDSLIEAGVLVGGEALEGVETATSLRIKAGKVETMDGPFAETKELLGGFYIIDVPDLDSALKYAAMIPAAAHGTIELRPVMDLSAMMEG